MVERKPLSCIAVRTVGREGASNSSELGQALRITEQAKPRPAGETRSIPLEATEGGHPVSSAVFTVTKIGGSGMIAENVSGSITLAPGHYRISAVTDTRTGQSDVEVMKNAPLKIVVTLTADRPKASLQPARASVPATETLEVKWTGPNGKDDYIVFAQPNGNGRETRHFGYTRDGNPLRVRVPGESGDYELRYVSDASGAILARGKITVTPVTATLNAPAQGVAGSEIAVTFTGPNAPEDWVGLAKAGADARAYEAGAWRYANNDSPAPLHLPVEPGFYEVRYVSGLDPKILAAKQVEVTAASASVMAPARGMAGATIQVSFSGTGSGDSFIGVVKQGAEERAWISGAYHRPDRQQVSLRLPGEPGPYEVRFVLEANGVYKVLASTPIMVEPAVASISAPDQARPGSEVTIAITGPKGDGDRVAIAPVGTAPDAFIDYRDATPDKSSVTLRAPSKPGAYEVRYVMRAPGTAGRRVIARTSLRIQ